MRFLASLHLIEFILKIVLGFQAKELLMILILDKIRLLFFSLHISKILIYEFVTISR